MKDFDSWLNDNSTPGWNEEKHQETGPENIENERNNFEFNEENFIKAVLCLNQRGFQIKELGKDVDIDEDTNDPETHTMKASFEYLEQHMRNFLEDVDLDNNRKLMDLAYSENTTFTCSHPAGGAFDVNVKLTPFENNRLYKLAPNVSDLSEETKEAVVKEWKKNIVKTFLKSPSTHTIISLFFGYENSSEFAEEMKKRRASGYNQFIAFYKNWLEENE